MTLAQAHAMLPGSVLVGDGATRIVRVHSDTRTLQAGDLFVALTGERFDAHAFLPQAKASGAVAAIAEHGLAEAGLAGLQVADTQQALTDLARAWRAGFDLPLIAVTGSNGKTTVTQMIASVLRAWVGEAAFATAGNLNNHIGVPLTLLRLGHAAPDALVATATAHVDAAAAGSDDDAVAVAFATTGHRAAVVELGMNHPGEIAVLAALAAPTVALVNNAQREHQEFMPGVDAVARENGAVIEALGATGTAVFPADDAHAPLWKQLAGARRTVTFALAGEADVSCHAEWVVDHWAVLLQTPVGTATLTLQVAGWHNVKNALAATACALAAGCPLDAVTRGLEAFAPVKGRSQVKALVLAGRPVTLIDDSYNANPDSVRAAIDVLATLPAPRWLVLGDMGEVGDQGPAMHREVGAYAQARGIDALWALGDASRATAAAFDGARHFGAMDELLGALPQAPAFAAVVVKGSRFMKMERVVAALGAMATTETTTDAEAAHAA